MINLFPLRNKRNDLMLYKYMRIKENMLFWEKKRSHFTKRLGYFVLRNEEHKKLKRDKFWLSSFFILIFQNEIYCKKGVIETCKIMKKSIG